MGLMKNRFFIFVFLNLFLYLFIALFHGIVPFSKFNYIYNAHHYLKDPRIDQKPFNFLIALGQYDAQWYLKIANSGYPNHPKSIELSNKKSMDGLSYAFFPFYPLILGVFNILLKNIQLTAFLVTNAFLILNFFSLYIVVKDFFPKTSVFKTIFLLFLFPFSIFYRSYFPEGLYLFLLLWFVYFIIKKNFAISAIFLGLLNITRGNGLLLNVYFFYLLFREVRKHKMHLLQALSFFVLVILPFALWIFFCFVQTGNPFYFYVVRSSWFSFGFIPPVLHNMLVVFAFPVLPLHQFHYSKIDVLSILLGGFLLIKSKKFLPNVLWWISLCLYLTPLLITDTMSFSRYQIVNFPLFIYMAAVLRKYHYAAIISACLFFLLLISLFFVNWYWIG